MQKEINKFLKKINVEKLKNNHKECIELYNIVGGLYSDISSYEEAIYYHEKALELCKTIGDRLGTAMALRYIGESKASLGNYYQAIDYVKKYLDLAKNINNKVEIQRAWTTLGRIYLMQAQDMRETSHNIITDSIQDAADEAEKKFQTALNLTGSIRDQVDEKEFAQMNSSLLVNLGLVKDICGQHQESVAKFNRAIEICKAAKLKEDLYRCQIILASIYRKKQNIKLAVKTCEEALITAKQIGKKLLICDALIENGLVKICLRDFKNAKRAFAQAYLEKSPSEEDHHKAIRLTKLTHLISETFDKISQDGIASDSRMKLCDKLGDLFVAIEFYKLAIEFYKKALTDARICSKPKSEIARILYSIAETYSDDGQFKNAMLCYEKELEFRNGNDKEQCQSLIKIAHMQEYLESPNETVCQAYERALEKANKDPILMHNVLKDYIPYMRRKSYNRTRLEELENVNLNLNSYPEVLNEIQKNNEEEIDELEDEIANIDDIISDDDDNDEVMMLGRRKTRGGKKFKPNEVGDTPLHEACIKGDIKRVKSLIGQGHEVNPRDNAGWIPLHEACNHGHYDIVEYLIEHGGDVNNRGLKGMTPLHDSATNGHFEIMRLLIKNNANVIALTDTGETVLSCLRDYKKRNYEQMSNSESFEYKQMESELLNIMDKRGFNLMESNIKNLGHKGKASSSASTSSAVIDEVKPIKTNRLNVLESEKDATSNPVRDYKKTIKTLKRKRTIIDDDDEQELHVKPNLPATYNTEDNTSAPTKDWLIDDVTRNKRILPIARNRRFNFEFDEDDELPSSSDDNADDLTGGDVRKKDDDILEVVEANEPASTTLKPSRHESNVRHITRDHSPILQKSPEPVVDITQDSQSRDTILSFPTSIRSNSETNNSRSNQRSFSVISPFNLMEQPLSVRIEGRKLLIPIKDDDSCTIKWLKETVIERYATLSGAKPNISLAPVSDPACLLFDQDLCKDVIRENLLAIVNSWQIDSISKCYLENCSKFGVKSLKFIENEMKKIDDLSCDSKKLDLSYTRIPKNQIKCVMQALARREFIDVNLMGSSLFDNLNSITMEVLNSIGSWKKLVYLRLNLTGLRKNQFEFMCTKMNLPELQFLDISSNPMEYKSKTEFRKQFESLSKSCPKLTKLQTGWSDFEMRNPD